MKRSYLSPALLLAVPMGIVCFIFFYAAFSAQNLTAAGLLIASGLLILGVSLYCICPIVSFDEKQIYILRLFFRETKTASFRLISPDHPSFSSEEKKISSEETHALLSANREYTRTKLIVYPD